MKKYFVLFIACIALCGCINPDPVEEPEIVFSVDVQYPVTATKSNPITKQDWWPGDRIFLFFESTGGSTDVTAYLILTLNDKFEWVCTTHGSTFELYGAFDAGFHLDAVHLPYGNSIEPEWSDASHSWRFDKDGDDYCSYYLYAKDIQYDLEDVPGHTAVKVSASFTMGLPSGFVQFYIPGSGDHDLLLYASDITPVVIEGFDKNGNIVTRDLNFGPMRGYVHGGIPQHTNKGIMFSGRAESPLSIYDKASFNLENQYCMYFYLTDLSSYKEYSCFKLYENTRLGNYETIVLKSIDNSCWVNQSDFVRLCGYMWSTKNINCQYPWELGGYYTFDEASLPSDESVPTYQHYVDLVDAFWIGTRVHGQRGYLIYDQDYDDTHHFMFLPMGGYIDSDNVSHDPEKGYYWTSTVDIGDENRGLALVFPPVDNTSVDWSFIKTNHLPIRTILK